MGRKNRATALSPVLACADPQLRKTSSLQTPRFAPSVFYHDLPAPRAARWVTQLQPHGAGRVLVRVPTCAAWRHGLTTYVFCEEDGVLFPVVYVRLLGFRLVRMRRGVWRRRWRRLWWGIFLFGAGWRMRSGCCGGRRGRKFSRWCGLGEPRWCAGVLVCGAFKAWLILES